MTIKGVGIPIIQGGTVKLLPVEHNCTIDRVLDYVPELCEKTEKIINKIMNKKENTEEIKIKSPKIRKTGTNYKYDYEEQKEESKNEDE